MIVYKETDEWHRMATSDSEWQQVLQQMTTSGNEWHQVVQLVTTSGTASDNEWQKMTTSNKKWQWIITNDSEWQNEWIGMRVSKIQWFCFKRKKRPIWKANPLPELFYSIFYATYNYYQNQPFADVFRKKCSWSLQYSQESACIGVSF